MLTSNDLERMNQKEIKRLGVGSEDFLRKHEELMARISAAGKHPVKISRME